MARSTIVTLPVYRLSRFTEDSAASQQQSLSF
jgi:hypothetical protein